MCRFLGYLSATPGPLPAEVFDAFPEFAWTGRVGPMESPGHDDGWGVWIRRGNDDVWFRSATTLKHELDRYGALIRQCEDQSAVAAICHLRKTSGSPRAFTNTQPFVRDGLAFSHNGTVFEAETLGCSRRPTGESDSERLFLFIGDRVAEHGFTEGICKAITSLRVHSWTALNFVLTNGQMLAAYRGYDEERDHMDARRRYYEMFYAADEDTVLVSSEPISNRRLRWTALSNDSLLVVKRGLVEVIRPA